MTRLPDTNTIEFRASVTRGKNGRGKPRCIVTEFGDNGFSTCRFVCEAANIDYAERIASALNRSRQQQGGDDA